MTDASEDKQITVKELREQLVDLPDDFIVSVECLQGSRVACGGIGYDLKEREAVVLMVGTDFKEEAGTQS